MNEFSLRQELHVSETMIRSKNAELSRLNSQLTRLQAENERLREALIVISGIHYSHLGCAVHARIAREALNKS